MADAAAPGPAQPSQPEPAPSAPSQAKMPPERPLPADELPEPEGGRWEALPALVQEVVENIVQDTEAQNAAAEQPARPVAASGAGAPAAAGERGTKRAYTALADIPASQRTRDGILQMRLADGSAFRCDEASPVEEQVREAKRWMRLTGASGSAAVSLTHDGTAVPRPRCGATSGQAKYVWTKLTIGRVRVRRPGASGREPSGQWHGMLLMPPEKRQAVVHKALELNLDRYRITQQELESITLDTLRSIPDEERSLRAQNALAKADGGAKHAISVGWISNLRKAMKVERAKRESNGGTG